MSLRKSMTIYIYFHICNLLSFFNEYSIVVLTTHNLEINHFEFAVVVLD